MVFRSRNNHPTTSEACSAPRAEWTKYFLVTPFVVLAFVLYAIAQSFNPDSYFCVYTIYKQPDGTCQVWWTGKIRRFEGTFATYGEAKRFQMGRINSLQQSMSQKPAGERIK